MRYLWVLSLIISGSEMLLLHFDSEHSVTLHGKGISDHWEFWGPPNNDPSRSDICSLNDQ